MSASRLWWKRFVEKVIVRKHACHGYHDVCWCCRAVLESVNPSISYIISDCVFVVTGQFVHITEPCMSVCLSVCPLLNHAQNIGTERPTKRPHAVLSQFCDSQSLWSGVLGLLMLTI